ncbi:F-BAR domain only protein 2 isoform X2 [Trichogramma pretiosum]|uniref:F-BAR domain only protein 2 isoform X2 n=1 Tax=Trichogramma pretiosum TaxID=7493 RepID=UPI000C71C7CD|nr:F-BAR domain only protein 2 isoform X2 [Trichogramma pretiosum]
MTVDFADYFWGEKNNGFDVLYHNMKHGVVASKELADFLRERSVMEENNYKLLSKVAKQASNSNSTQGTFSPIWTALRTAAEKLAGLHLQLAQKVSEIIKDVAKYSDELHKKHKNVKEEESSTLDVVQNIQSITITLQKAKDTCMQRGLELEKLKKDNASQKELEKADIKFRKAQDDYKTLVDKYTTVRNDFEAKMTQACRRFQDVEESHLRIMKEFLNTYADVLQSNHEQIGQVHIDFKRQCLDMTVEKLLEQFVQSKYTGFEKPGIIEYDQVLTSIAEITSQSSIDKSNETQNKEATKGANGETGVAGNLEALKKTQGVKREGYLTRRGRFRLDKDKDEQNERESEGVESLQQSKTSRRTTSLLNLFMSNSQERQRQQAGSGSAPVTPQDSMSPGVPTASISRNPLRGSKWFLRSRREKRKEKKAKKKKDSVETSGSKDEAKSDTEDKEQESSLKSAGTPTLEVDEEGYCIKPKAPDGTWDSQEKSNFYSSSDSDSEDERERKIRVEIKPLRNGAGPMSASVDELRATVENLSLSPAPGLIGGSGQGGLSSLRGGTRSARSTPAPTLMPPPPSSSLQSTRRGSQATSTGFDPDGLMKRSQSVSQQLSNNNSGSNSKTANSELLLNSIFSPSQTQQSSASTPLQSPPTVLPMRAQSTPIAAMMPPPPQSAPARTASFFPEGDLFSEMSDAPGPALPPKQQHQQSSIAIPRPPSRRGDPGSNASVMSNNTLGPSASRGRMSPATISRADSVASLEFRSAGVAVGTSRGPSPLTIGMSDTIPLAVAFHEIVHAYFRGSDESRCQVKLVGDMMLSFPAGIVAVLTSNPSPAKLSFRLRNSGRLERLVPNSQLVNTVESPSAAGSPFSPTSSSQQQSSTPDSFEFNMSALTALLRRQAEQNPQAAYFNVDILKYQVKARDGAASCPFQLVAYWKTGPTHTDLKVDYKYNSRAMAAPNPLLNLQLSVPIDGGFRSVQSQPNAQWLPESNRLIWKFTELSQLSDGTGVGSLKARVELSNGPGNQGTIFTQFNCEGTTLSGVEFELAGPGYRVSLIKKRFISGKYLCDGDVDLRTRYAAPPNIE